MTREKDKKPGKEQQLLEAARLGQVDQLETLLNQFQLLKTKKRSNPLASLRKCVGPNTIRDPVTGFTCLHHAALNGHSQAVRLIVTYGGRLNAVDYKGSTALHLAAWSGNLQVVKTLTSYLEAAPQAAGGRGSDRFATLSASSEATATTSTSTSTSTPFDSARAPLAVQTKQQIKSSSPKQNRHTSQQQQVASPDAGDGAAQQQQELEIDHRNNDNQTALSLAAQFGHSQVVAELLAHGADPNLRNNQLESPLDLACLNGHLDTVRVLLNSSALLVEDLRKPHSTISISTRPLGHAQTAPHDDDPAQAKRYLSASGWSSLLRGTTMKDLSPTSERSQRAQRRATMAPGSQQASKQQTAATNSPQCPLDSSTPTVSEQRFLDHSPVHYAVRRAHLAIVDLLLNYYEANIYQLTSLGSVMHELVMGNHSFRDATRSSDSLKRYPHSDMMRVFLARLNRMSAGNPNETRTRWQHLLSARNGQQRSVFDMLNDINNRTAQELQKAILDVSEHLEHNLNRRGQQPVNQLGPQRPQVFSNSQHLNSFVTMKRAPKQQPPSKSTRTRDDDESRQQRQQGAIPPDGTQTIGRRKIAAESAAQSADAPHREYQFDPASLARSISSQGRHNDHHATTHPADTERPSTINWPALSGQHNQHYAPNQLQRQQQQQPNQSAQAVRKRRSKSRDLGSILKEVNQKGDTSSTDQEQLYDNQLLPSMDQQHHLVRSQTDCTHLLGRLFGQHENQQLALVNGGRPPGGEHGLHAADLTRQQQLNQHAHSSENSSLVSGLDQQRLVPTSIAQQHSATLDRRAINRHYHVYEHEFYPPRLVTAAHQAQGNKAAAVGHHASDRAKQVVAIVPPLIHNPSHSIEGGTHRFSHAAPHAINNSRLSLNMEQPVGHNGQLADATGCHQRDQMNRFVGRSSRKSTGGQLGGCDRANQQDTATMDTSQGGYDSERQPRPSTLMPRPQSMHSSQSLESRLGADSQQALSFENTRRALMRDFDKMIGRELLNTNGNNYSDHSSDGGQSSRSRHMVNSTSSSSQNSILTGVSLDMDTRGEHLIVSGTRITMPDVPPAAKMTSQSISSGSTRSSPPSNQASRRVSPRDSSAQTARKSSQHTQTGSDNLSQSSLASSVDQKRREPPPQKPPRPSLESQQIYKALRMGGRAVSDLKQQHSPVIYDVPSHNNSASNLAEPAPVLRRPGSAASMNSSNALIAKPSDGAPPARPPQPKPRRSGGENDFSGDQQQQQVSITQPPTVRPPPPPVPPTSAVLSSPFVTSPLEVITDTSKRDRLRGPLAPGVKLSLSSSSSCNSPTSSSSSSFKARNEQEARNIVRVGAEGGDSGVCTSNSPASTGRDSEGGRPALELSFGSRAHSKPGGGAGSAIMAPPSPRTAQMSIEEAFMPLEETPTQEVANQTHPDGECPSDLDLDDDDDDAEEGGRSNKPCFELDEEIEQATSFELGSQVDEIFGWLGATNKSLEDPQLVVAATSAPIRAGYENCAELQDRLRASRCRLIGDLFRGIASELNATQNRCGRSTASGGSSVKIVSTRTCSSDEGDYAATSEIQAADQPESSSAENSSSSLEAQPVVGGKRHDSQCTTTPMRHCKEIMVRVVVDESQKGNNGDDVFYINPLELKKISSKVEMAHESTNTVVDDTLAQQCSEAETLTEEELCASVDKSSGYIRFTLRKRRTASADANDSHIDSPLPPSLEQRQVSPTNDPLELLESTSAKRTKMNSDEKGEEETVEKLPEDPPEANQCESNETMQQVIEHDERNGRVGSRKPSGDSISMDTSQVSSSSSTSEMSIKSIVSLKVQPPESSSIDIVQAPSALAPVNDKQNGTVNANFDNSETETENSREQTPTPVSIAQPVPSKQIDEKEAADTQNQVEKTPVGRNKVASSLVSETARRLEAAAAARAASGPPPAAAARKTLARNSSNADNLKCEKENARPPVLPPKKSICWPPKRATDDDDDEHKAVVLKKVDVEANGEPAVAQQTKTTTLTPTGPVVGRVSANRLSFQRLIEEKSKAAAASANNTLSRPKPPPPVKPAGLIVPASFKS